MLRVRAWVWIPWMVLAVAVMGCGGPTETEPGAESENAAEQAAQEEERIASYVQAVEDAHGLDAWSSQDAVSARIELTFGGNPALDGRMIFTPSMSKVRLDQGEASVIWDGETAWVTPADAEFPRARFHVLTWPYFLAAPMKLRDPGTHLELLGAKQVETKLYDAARLTFDEDVGDTPEDWYIVYREPQTHRLEAMAYVVTYGTTPEEANEEPHAIVFSDFQDVEGVAIPTTWTFRLWSEDKRGVHGDPLGEAKLTDVKFVTPDEETFAVPDDAREAPIPQPAASGEPETPDASEASEAAEES